MLQNIFILIYYLWSHLINHHSSKDIMIIICSYDSVYKSFGCVDRADLHKLNQSILVENKTHSSEQFGMTESGKWLHKVSNWFQCFPQILWDLWRQATSHIKFAYSWHHCVKFETRQVKSMCGETMGVSSKVLASHLQVQLMTFSPAVELVVRYIWH